MEVDSNNVVNAQWSQIADGPLLLDTVTHLAENLLLSHQQPPLKLHQGLHYTTMFLQADFAFQQQDLQTLQGCGANSAPLSWDVKGFKLQAQSHSSVILP